MNAIATPPRWLAWLAGAWALWYAAYRAYYAFGGTFGMFGTPASFEQWRLINGIAAALLLGAAILPVATAGLWHRPWVKMALLGFGWIVFVGCVMHALVNVVLRGLSLTGAITIDYPFWDSIDARAADLQDLFLNEPWFFVEGLLWAALCLAALNRGRLRTGWLASGVVAIVALTAIGILSGIGAIGQLVFG